MKAIVLGTRGSPLALAQARLVEALLTARDPGIRVQLHPIRTEGDELPSEAKMGAVSGKALFTGRIETALQDGLIDAAVHSLKDLPAASGQGIVLAATPAREDPRDVWISRSHVPFAKMPRKATIATSSLRRAAQLRRWRPELTIRPLQGNVGTRLQRLAESTWDGIVLASAGIRRLALADRITEPLAPSLVLPAPGQGALAIQARRDDASLLKRLAEINDPPTRAAIEAERSFAHALGGDCNVPLAALATLEHEDLRLQGRVLDPGGRQAIEGVVSGPAADAEGLGRRLARQLEAQGVRALLEATVP